MEMGTVRFVKDDTIVSRALPEITVRYSDDFIYLGNLQYISKDTHWVEVFIFIEPNARGHAASLMLVHFEGLLEHMEGTYEETGERTVDLAGKSYQYQRRMINAQEALGRGQSTHLALAADYIRQRAYTLAGDMVYHRFFRHLEPDQRNMFSISYLEAVDDAQSAAAQAGQEPSEAQAMLQHALEHFEILS